MRSPFLVGIKRGILISLGLVIFWLLLDFLYLSKLESTNKSNLELEQVASIGGDFDLIGKSILHPFLDNSSFSMSIAITFDFFKTLNL